MMNLTPELKLAAGRHAAMKRFPYLAQMLLAMSSVRVPDGTLDTMAVTENAVLLWDAKDVLALTVEQVATSLVHECLHLLNFHAKRRRDRDHKLWNSACDLAINCDLRAAGCDMIANTPKAMLLPEMFELPDKLTAEAYYDLLQTSPKVKKPRPCCGSGAGHKHAAEDNIPNGGAQGSDENAPGRSAAELDAVRSIVAQAVVAHEQKNKGTVPNNMLVWAGQQVKKPVVRWQDILRSKVRGALAATAGSTHTTYAKPARKQAGLGFGLGVPVLTATIARKPHVVVAIDTSGSMLYGNALGDAVSELSGIFQTMQCPVEVMTADAKLQVSVHTQSLKSACDTLKGGGGTSFLPVLNHIGARSKDRPSLLIYMTDGEGDCPSVKPANLADVRVVWLICGRGMSQPWGENIYALPQKET